MESLFKSNEAVSPVVASLLLILVASVGAGGVAILMGEFGDDVEGINPGDLGDAASIRIDIIGSDLHEGAALKLIERYEDVNMGVSIHSEGDNTDSGINAVGIGSADICASDREITIEDLEKYPDLQSQQIGNAIIVVISNPKKDFTKTDLQGLYNGTNSSMNAYQYEGTTGIEDRFWEYLNISGNESEINSLKNFENMVKYVKGTQNSVGFIPLSYIGGDDSVLIAGVENGTGTIIESSNITFVNVTKAVRDDNDSIYPQELRPPLYYVTNGNPAAVTDSFISWVKSPEGQMILTDSMYVSLY